MTDEYLKQLEKQYLDHLDNEENEEQKMVNQAKEIAARLMLNSKIRMELFDAVYTITYTANSNRIVIVFADPIKYQFAPKAYRPYTVVSEMENNLSLKENLECACEAFLRHEAGKDKVEEL